MHAGESGERAPVGLEYCSSAERLARDVQHLLLRFGIVSRLRKMIDASAALCS